VIPQWLQAVVLGVLQGATEFIPVSSSGHLVLVPYLLGWERPGLAFDVALHAGTALAIFLYFRRELGGMVWAVFRGGGTREGRLYRRLAVLLVAASVPVAVVGLLFKDTFEQLFETPPVAASFLLVTAVVLVAGEKVRDRRVRRARERAPSGAGSPQVWTGDWVGERTTSAPP
jgi:undecaprenyl-diphosphatase